MMTPKERLMRQVRGEETDRVPTLGGWIGGVRTLAALGGLTALEDARAEVDYFIDHTDGGRRMFLFTSNVTGVEVPPENLRAAYAHAQAWDPRRQRTVTHPHWPSMGRLTG